MSADLQVRLPIVAELLEGLGLGKAHNDSEDMNERQAA